MTEMLNYRQFSEKFPLCNNCISSNDAWALLLKRWRDDGKLVERRHWRYGPSVDGNNQPTRLYDAKRVIKLVVSEYQAGSRRPRIDYLCQNYATQFTEIINSVASVASVDKQ